MTDPDRATAQAMPPNPPPLQSKKPMNYHYDNLSEEDKADFVKRLRAFMFAGENDTFEWGRAKTMAVVVLRRRAMLDAHAFLEDRGFGGGSEGGFKVPEDMTSTKVDDDG